MKEKLLSDDEFSERLMQNKEFLAMLEKSRKGPYKTAIFLRHAECKMLVEFLEDLYNRLTNESCNDFDLPDTQENRDFLMAMAKRSHDDMLIEDLTEDFKKPLKDKGKLHTFDWGVVGHLKHLIEEQI